MKKCSEENMRNMQEPLITKPPLVTAISSHYRTTNAIFGIISINYYTFHFNNHEIINEPLID